MAFQPHDMSVLFVSFVLLKLLPIPNASNQAQGRVPPVVLTSRICICANLSIKLGLHCREAARESTEEEKRRSERILGHRHDLLASLDIQHGKNVAAWVVIA